MGIRLGVPLDLGPSHLSKRGGGCAWVAAVDEEVRGDAFGSVTRDDSVAAVERGGGVATPAPTPTVVLPWWWGARRFTVCQSSLSHRSAQALSGRLSISSALHPTRTPAAYNLEPHS